MSPAFAIVLSLVPVSCGSLFTSDVQLSLSQAGPQAWRCCGERQGGEETTRGPVSHVRHDEVRPFVPSASRLSLGWRHRLHALCATTMERTACVWFCLFSHDGPAMYLNNATCHGCSYALHQRAVMASVCDSARLQYLPSAHPLLTAGCTCAVVCD